MRQSLEPTVRPTGRLGLLQGVDQIGQGPEVDLASAFRCADGQADRQVRLADTGRTHDTMLTLRPPLESTTPFTL